MIEAKVTSERLQRVYDLAGPCYRASASLFDRKARRLGLRHAQVKPGESVLDVGCGPGITLREAARQVGGGSLCVGVDFSARMLRMGRHSLASRGPANATLVQADARSLPFPSAAFDVVLSAYVLDLMPLSDIEETLHEFRRVLRPGGRMVLVSMTGWSESSVSPWEMLYRALPPWAAAWLLGGCRPVFLAGPAARAGFHNARRHVVRQLIPSEIVLAERP